MSRINQIFCEISGVEDIEEKQYWLNPISIEWTEIEEEPELTDEDIKKAEFLPSYPPYCGYFIEKFRGEFLNENK